MIREHNDRDRDGEHHATVEPRVSVVIATKDRTAVLRRAVSSVLRQTFSDFEVIIVDDASKDESARQLCELDHRVRYVRHELSKGESGARNTGISVARGEYFAFLDDDDEWYPEKLERQVRVLEGAPADVGVVYTGVETRELSGKIIVERAKARGNVYDKLFEPGHKLPVNNISMLVKRACFEDVGVYDETLPYGVAWDIHVRLAKRWKFLPVEDPLVIIHRPTHGISTDSKRVIAGHRYLNEKYKAEMARRPRWRNTIYFTLGLLELKRGNVDQSRKDLRQAIVARPLRWKPWACLAVTFLPGPIRQRAVPGSARGSPPIREAK